MRKIKLFLLSLILIFSFATGVSAEYFSDVIVTSPNGIWTDARSYSTLNSAITAVGANQRTIVIASSQTVTNLTVPANVTLKFERDGAINNSGQLTINTKSIIADDHQIFTGLGDIDFAAGVSVKLSWFHNLWNALTMTSDDHVTLIINKAINATASCAVGNDVILKWEAANIISANAGVTISNISQIEAGNYQILAGAGNFRFLDGSVLNLKWFPYLRTALTWINTNNVTLVVNESSDVDYSDAVPINIQLKVVEGGALDISPGITLTLANSKQMDIGPYLSDPFTGTGSVAITGGFTYTPATTLTAAILQGLFINPIITDYSYEVDALIAYGEGVNYTDTVLMAACTAVGTDLSTILVRPGTWTQTVDRDYTAVCPNAIFRLPNGVFIDNGGHTLTIRNIDAGKYQIFSGAGTVIYTGKKYPEWWGAKDDSGTTDNTEEIQAALTNGGEVELSAPNGGYYKITDELTVSVAGTKIFSDSMAEIKQSTAAKKGFNITASNVTVDGLTITGYQHAAYNTGETAVYATGTDDTTRITDVTVKNCNISNWGWEGIRFDWVDRATAVYNYIDDVVYSGIQGRNANYTDFSHNTVTDISPGSATGIMVGIILSGTTSQATTSKHGKIADNYVYNTKQAILLEPASYITITGNSLYDNIAGIVIKEHSSGGYSSFDTATGNTIVNGTITAGDTYYGIQVGGNTSALYCTVTGNTIYNYGSATYGAIHSSGNVGVLVANNNIITSYKYGIVFSGSTYSKCSGNNIYGVGAETVAGSAGIYVGPGCTYSSITDNNINSGIYYPILINGLTLTTHIDRNNYITTNAGGSIANPTYGDLGLYKTFATFTATGITAGSDLATRRFAEDTINVGTVIRFSSAGAKSGSAGNKTINIVFGSTSITAHAAANNTNDWRIQGEIIFTTLSSQYISWTCFDGATITQGYDAASEDISAGDLILKLSAVVAGASDTVTQRMWIVEKLQ